MFSESLEGARGRAGAVESRLGWQGNGSAVRPRARALALAMTVSRRGPYASGHGPAATREAMTLRWRSPPRFRFGNPESFPPARLGTRRLRSVSGPGLDGRALGHRRLVACSSMIRTAPRPGTLSCNGVLCNLDRAPAVARGEVTSEATCGPRLRPARVPWAGARRPAITARTTSLRFPPSFPAAVRGQPARWRAAQLPSTGSSLAVTCHVLVRIAADRDVPAITLTPCPASVPAAGPVSAPNRRECASYYQAPAAEQFVRSDALTLRSRAIPHGPRCASSSAATGQNVRSSVLPFRAPFPCGPRVARESLLEATMKTIPGSAPQQIAARMQPTRSSPPPGTTPNTFWRP